jgi:hypothetical protein
MRGLQRDGPEWRSVSCGAGPDVVDDSPSPAAAPVPPLDDDEGSRGPDAAATHHVDSEAVRVNVSPATSTRSVSDKPMPSCNHGFVYLGSQRSA